MKAGASASFSKSIGLTSKLLSIFFNEALFQSGLQITLNQFIVLRILSHHDGIYQNNLALVTERDKTSLTRLIKTLELKGLVMRQTNIEDKRKKKVLITNEGLGLLAKAVPVMTKHQNEAKEGITTTELEILIKILNKVQSNITPGKG